MHFLSKLIVSLVVIVSILGSSRSDAATLKKANPKCKEDCSQTLSVGKQTFRYSHTASLALSATYENIEWAIVSQPFKSGKKTLTRYFLHNSNNRKIRKSFNICSASERDITIQGEVVCFSADSIEVSGEWVGKQNEKFDLEFESKSWILNHNANGTVTFAALVQRVDQEQEDSEEFVFEIRVNDLSSLRNNDQSWLTELTNLHRFSDFTGVLAVDSRGKRKYSVAVYEWINTYNRGLVLYNFANETLLSRTRVNPSEEVNFGFDPRVVVTQSSIVVSALNSSLNQRQSKTYRLEDLGTLTFSEHQFSEAFAANFLVGAGVQPAFWHIDQKVEVDDNKKASVDYEMNTNLLSTYFVQGRWGNSQLAVTLLQNRAEDAVDDTVDNRLIREAIKEYIIQYDYHGLFNGANTLRLQYSSMNAGGSAQYETHTGEIEYRVFESERVDYEALLVGERGMYYGGYYTQYDSPSAIGVLNASKSFEGVTFADSLSISKFGILIGYDEAAYGSRYETDYQRWFFSGEAGIGVSSLGVNRDDLFDAVGTREGDIHGKHTFDLNAKLDVGYIWQRRARILNGLGFSAQVGYKLQYEYMDQSPEDSDTEYDDGWLLNYKRHDFIHGPYIRLNLMY